MCHIEVGLVMREVYGDRFWCHCDKINCFDGVEDAQQRAIRTDRVSKNRTVAFAYESLSGVVNKTLPTAESRSEHYSLWNMRFRP
jgi:hypothetical protein